MDAVLLDAELACIVGILPRERIDPQPLRIALRMSLDLEPTGDSGDLSRSIDYGEVDAQVRFLAIEGRFLLIESLALAILRTVLAAPAPGEPRAQVAEAVVRITKPAVLLSAAAGVELSRTAAWATGRTEALDTGGTAEGIVSLPEVRVRRLSLPAGTLLSEGVARGIVGVQGRVGIPFRSTGPCVLLAVERTPWVSS